MTDNAIKHRRRIRERFDATAIHATDEMDASHTEELVRLDIVARKITIGVPAGVTVTVTGSANGLTFFAIGTGLVNTTVTYGDTVGDHLVKVIKVVRTAGAGKVTVVGA